MSTLIWLILAFLYVAALVAFGLATLRAGLSRLVWARILFPVIVGAVIAPTPDAPAA